MTQREMKDKVLNAARVERDEEINSDHGCGLYCVVCLCDVKADTFQLLGGFCRLCALRIALGEMPANEHPDDSNHNYT